ncbi:MAG: radical SAM protein [Euryarchaeota archaeon]|nr:radical SAM protein [Euryarchaeota archaeon]
MKKKTKSICPVCHNLIDAVIFDNDNKIYIEKNCKNHGTFRDVYWGDTEQYYRFEKYLHDGNGITNHFISDKRGCPQDCGICGVHKTNTILANIDVTNRCNLRCPICFANAAASGYLYEPTVEQIHEMMTVLRSQEPVKCTSIQFTGGEPTMRLDLFHLIRMAREMGFKHIQLATNGLKLSESVNYCYVLRESGLKTLYLQFDSVNPEPYLETRGFNALPIKLKAIQNCREAKMPIDIVPTVIKGINDNELGDMVRFVADNIDIIKGINFQPVSFTGRVDSDKREQQRITIPEVLNNIDKQTNGAIISEDFYPVPFIAPLTNFANAITGFENVEFSIHPHCGAGAHVYVDNEKKMTPIARFVDVEGLHEYFDELALEIEDVRYFKTIARWRGIRKLLRGIRQHVDDSNAPKDIDFPKNFLNLFVDRSGNAIKVFHKKMMFIGIMHFQDLYNMDIERIQRCGIHYAVPDGRVIPFCTYNSLYRTEIEKKFSRPLD